ncbi:hypothetical protein [Janibacter sp. G56]|uniref:hypothetical protein n=1 Tax=Janibacter sp. G56 TaxID=3418717 RepID=UPI003CFF1632
MRMTWGAIVAVASMAGLGACSAEPSSDASATVTATSSSSRPEKVTKTTTVTATASTTRTTSPAPTTTPRTTPTMGPLPTDIGSYADAFVRAWGIGDQPSASRYATVTTVSSLFAMDPRGGSTWKRGSQVEQDGRMQVRYTDGAGTALYVLIDRGLTATGSEDAIVAANLEYEGDSTGYDAGEEAAGVSDIAVAETTVAAYCDALVRAWGAGQRSTADKYATQTAMTQLFDGYGTEGGSWSRSSSDAYSATYTDASGTTLTLWVEPQAVVAGRGDGAYIADFS